MRNLKAITIGLAFSLLCSIPAFASTHQAGWIQDNTGWWYQNEDGSYPVNTWKWIDGNNDNIAECYYFDNIGYMVDNKIVDGYAVNENGAWTENGQVQIKIVETEVYKGENEVVAEPQAETPKNNTSYNNGRVFSDEDVENNPYLNMGIGGSGKGSWDGAPTTRVFSDEQLESNPYAGQGGSGKGNWF